MEAHPLPELEEEPLVAAGQCDHPGLAYTFLEHNLVCVPDGYGGLTVQSQDYVAVPGLQCHCDLLLR